MAPYLMALSLALTRLLAPPFKACTPVPGIKLIIPAAIALPQFISAFGFSIFCAAILPVIPKPMAPTPYPTPAPIAVPTIGTAEPIVPPKAAVPYFPVVPIAISVPIEPRNLAPPTTKPSPSEGVEVFPCCSCSFFNLYNFLTFSYLVGSS